MNTQPEALLNRFYEGEEAKTIITEAAEELRRLHEVNHELVEALETIATYWNQNTNHNAMQDACYYMEATARAAISKARGEA
jgi:hypothetical protein